MWPIAVGAGLGALAGLAGRDSDKTVGQSSRGSRSSSSQSQGSWSPHPYAHPFYGFGAEQGGYLTQNPVPFFPGQTYVGPSAPTQLGVAAQMQASQMGLEGAQNAYGQAGASQPYYGLGAQLLGRGAGAQANAAGTALGNYNFLSGAADVANNPYVQNQLRANERSVQKNLLESVIPQIEGRSAASGMLGSSADALRQGQALGDAAEALANTNASTMLNAYGQGLGAQQQALGSLSGLQQGFAAPGTTLGSAGTMVNQGVTDYLRNIGGAQSVANSAITGMGNAGQAVEGYQDQALRDSMQRFGYQYQEPYQRLQLTQGLAGLFQPMGTTYGSQAGYGANSGYGMGANPNYQSPLQAVLGGASAGAGIGSYF